MSANSASFSWVRPCEARRSLIRPPNRARLRRRVLAEGPRAMRFRTVRVRGLSVHGR
jgi:hypothetical protein